MPMTPETKGLFGDAAFAKMKKGARVVNVARGGVIDDAALVKALDAGIVAAAALDVFETEPPPADHPLTKRPDVVCTPHLGASTAEAQDDVGVEIAEAVIEALQGKLAATAVNAPMVAPEVLAELAPFVELAKVIRFGFEREKGGRPLTRAVSKILLDQPTDFLSSVFQSPLAATRGRFSPLVSFFYLSYVGSLLSSLVLARARKTERERAGVEERKREGAGKNCFFISQPHASEGSWEIGSVNETTDAAEASLLFSFEVSLRPFSPSSSAPLSSP